MTTIQELLDLERRGWDSLCGSTGDRFYGELMTEDGVMVLADGSVMDRSQVVAALAQSPAWKGYEISDERIVTIGPDSAALVYTGRGFRDGDATFVGTMSSVYVRRDDRWRLAFYQQTPSAAS